MSKVILLSPILSVVSSKIALSMTLESSRTFPGQSCFSSASIANLVREVIFPFLFGQIFEVLRKYSASSGMSSFRSGALMGGIVTGQMLSR